MSQVETVEDGLRVLCGGLQLTEEYTQVYDFSEGIESVLGTTVDTYRRTGEAVGQAAMADFLCIWDHLQRRGSVTKYVSQQESIMTVKPEDWITNDILDEALADDAM